VATKSPQAGEEGSLFQTGGLDFGYNLEDKEFKNMQNPVQFYPGKNRGTQPPTRPWELIYDSDFMIAPSAGAVMTFPEGRRLFEGNVVLAGEPLRLATGGMPGNALVSFKPGPAAGASTAVPVVNVAELSTSERITRERLHEVFRLLTQEPGRVTSTEARQRLAELSQWSAETQRPVLVTNHGKNELIILPYSLFQRVLKGIAREVLGFRSRRSHLSDRAEEILEAEAESINKRLRKRRDE
jgi:prevent-host-death family protein